jgi:hypothetical protein
VVQKPTNCAKLRTAMSARITRNRSLQSTEEDAAAATTVPTAVRSHLKFGKQATGAPLIWVGAEIDRDNRSNNNGRRYYFGVKLRGKAMNVIVKVDDAVELQVLEQEGKQKQSKRTAPLLAKVMKLLTNRNLLN